MKRFLIYLIIFFSINKIYSSPQMSDLIVISGDTLPLYSTPLEKYFAEYKIEFECLSTGNYRGYYAIWELKNDSLFLNKIFDCSKEYKNVIGEIFTLKGINSGIFAKWISDTLWVETGKKVFYQHYGWGSYYDQEKEFVANKGIIKSFKKYDYRGKIKIFDQKPDGLDLRDYINSRLKLEEPYKGKDQKVVISAYRNSVKILYPESIDTSDVYIKEVIRVVKELNPYTVVYLCGRKQIIQYSIPFELKNVNQLK